MSRGKQQVKRLTASRRKIVNHNLSSGPGLSNLAQTKIEFSHESKFHGNMTLTLERILDKTKIESTFTARSSDGLSKYRKVIKALLTPDERRELKQAVRQIEKDVKDTNGSPICSRINLLFEDSRFAVAYLASEVSTNDNECPSYALYVNSLKVAAPSFSFTIAEWQKLKQILG